MMDVSLEINKNNSSGRSGVQGAATKNGAGAISGEIGTSENTLAGCLRR